MKNIILFITLSLTLISCGTGRISTTETKTDEAIIFGRLTVNSEKEINHKDIRIHFNERLWGKNTVLLDENGYFATKLPLGQNDVAMIQYKEKSKNIPQNYISINIEDSNTIYYMGDVIINWNPSNKDADIYTGGGLIGGLGSALMSAKRKGEELPIQVLESDSTVLQFKKLFPNNTKEIKTQLVQFNITTEE